MNYLYLQMENQTYQLIKIEVHGDFWREMRII